MGQPLAPGPRGPSPTSMYHSLILRYHIVILAYIQLSLKSGATLVAVRLGK